MTLYGEEIINRLPETTGLKDPHNPFHNLIDCGVGGWLDEYAEKDFPEMIFINDAHGKWLDLHGSQYGVTRQLNETDEHYRQRIILVSLGHLTMEYLLDVYDLDVYVKTSNFTESNNRFTSDNPYLANHDGLMIKCSTAIKEILESKFPIGEDVIWL